MIPHYAERSQISNIEEASPSSPLESNSLETDFERSETDVDDPLSPSSNVFSPRENTEAGLSHDLSISTRPSTSSSRCHTPTSCQTPSTSQSVSEKKKQGQLPMSEVLQKYFEDKKQSRLEKKADHLRKFFDSIEETVRTFSPLLQIELKSKISNLVNEYEFKNYMDQTLNQNLNPTEQPELWTEENSSSVYRRL